MNTEELPLFPLARWELSPHLDSEPLVAPATARWHGELWGETTNWLVRVVRERNMGHLFISAEERIEEAKWQVIPMSLKDIEVREETNAAIAQHVQMVHSSLNRTFYFSDEITSWELSLSGSSEEPSSIWGGDKWAVDGEEYAIPFQMNWSLDFFSATAAQIEADVMRDWNDEASDLFFARKWFIMWEDERIEKMVSWKRGNRPEFEDAMKIVWRAFAPRVEEGNASWWFMPQNNQFEYRQFSIKDFDGETDEPFALHLWGDALLEIFGPQWNEKLTCHHLCIRQGKWRIKDHFRVDTSERTFHEQLEAARTLSDWLNQREARGELEAGTLAPLRETLR